MSVWMRPVAVRLSTAKVGRTGCRVDRWFEVRCVRWRGLEARTGVEPVAGRFVDVLPTVGIRLRAVGAARRVHGWHGCALVVRALGGSRTLIPLAGSSSSGWSVYLLRHERVTARCCGACPRRELNSHWRRPERRASAGWATRGWNGSARICGECESRPVPGSAPGGRLDDASTTCDAQATGSPGRRVRHRHRSAHGVVIRVFMSVLLFPSVLPC